MNVSIRGDGYDAIETELDYQRRRWGIRDEFNGTFAYSPKSVAEFILCMEEHLERARTAWNDNDGDDAALHMLRKVTALGVQCFEQHGCPLRPEGPTTNERDGKAA